MTAPPSIVGTATKRVEGGEKVSGVTKYVDDLSFLGQLCGALVHSRYAHAEIVSVDISDAMNVPGVVAVYTGKDMHPGGSEPSDRHHSMLARDKAIYYGQPVAVVLATNDMAAQEAVDLVHVEYKDLGAVVNPLKAMEKGAPVIRAKGGDADWSEGEAHAAVGGASDTIDLRAYSDNVTNAARFRRGDIEAGFAAADVIVERTYTSGFVHQAYIEPHATIVVPDPFGRLTIYTMTQGQFYTRKATAGVLGLNENDIKVHNLEIGGGFGSKSVLLEPIAGWLALKERKPIKIVYSRAEEFTAATPAPGSVIDVKIGAKSDGTITAIQSRLVFDSGAYSASPYNIGAILLGSYYKTDNLLVDAFEVLTNKPGVGAYRAPGAPQATFAIEQAVDELAVKLGMDPVEFRLHNASDEGDPQVNGMAWPRIGLKTVLETIRDHPMYKNRSTEPGKGVGIAIGGWPGGLEPCAANVKLNTDGSLVLQVGHSDITGTNTTFAMLVAEMFGTDLDNVKVQNGDTDTSPYAGMAGGSKTTFTVGPAVMKAAQAAREQVLTIAATEFEASADDLEMVDGMVRVKGTDQQLSVAQIATMSMGFGAKYEPVYGLGKSAHNDRAPGFSGHIAQVEVDPDTGQIRITDYVTIQDVGKALNPAAVEGQIIGGTVQAMGFALWEAMVYGDDGQLISETLMDYSVPKADQVPSMETILIEIPSRSGPFGAKGVGEPPIVPGAAAIANAASAATGKRFAEMPLTPERVSKVLNNGA